MKTFILTFSAFLMAATVMLVRAPALPAQPEPLVVFEDTGLTGTFCGYEESESGDNPPTMTLKTEKGTFEFFTLFPEVSDYEKAEALRAGTPVSFSVRILYAYAELEGGMTTLVGVSSIRASGGTGDASACRFLADRQYSSFAADKLAGHFCGYVPGTGGAPDKVSVKTGKGIYGLAPRLDGLEKLKALSDLAPGTPVTYDMAFRTSPDGDGPAGPPVATLSNFSVVGDPVPEACTAAQ
ncbi:MAG: hypothetical protein LBQ79_11975 [Deltaproteobacteria bacterium]|jgi:hypothetical protein|nr:hypothetical protein [Deltaproteobacteria bacterium]